MATPGRLFSLGAAMLCVMPHIEPAESFVTSPIGPSSSGATLFLGKKATCSRRSRCLPSGKEQSCRLAPPRPVCRSSENETSDHGAIDDRGRDAQHDISSSAARGDQIARDGTNGREVVSSKGNDSAPTKPHWVEDPDEGRVRMWMRAAGRKRDHDRVAMYLRKYREGKARKGELASTSVYNAALRALDECHKWRLALSVFREMQRDGVAADRNSYFFAVSACSRRGEARTAQELLAEMTAAQAKGGPAPDLLLYAVTAKACAGGRSWRQALRLLEEMSAAGVSPNVVMLNTVMSACAKCGQTALATKLLQDMQAKYGIAPDAISYNAVISGHERAGEWREALALAREMERSEGIAPTIVTFNSVIGACKRAGKATEALAVLGLLRRKGLHPDVISFNSAISACASGGKWESALQLLELMPSEGVTPDLTTYNSALDACVKSGQWEMTMSLFEELSASSDSSLVPDLYTYNTVMAVFSNSGMLPRALELLEQAKARGLRPDVVTYSTLIRACERASPSQPEVALQLVSDMEAAGVRPNNTTFVSVVLSLGRAERPLECLDVLEGMRERGTPPDAICYQTVLRVLDRWDRAEEVSELFREMCAREFVLTPSVAEETYCCGIRALEKVGNWSAAVSLLEEWRKVDGYDMENDAMYDQWYRALRLLSAGGLPEGTDAKTARAAMVSAARGGLAEEALAMMRNMEAAGFELGVVEYGAVMEALEKSGKPERSQEIFDEMTAREVEPDVLCFAAATRCSCLRKDWKSAISLVETTLRKGLIPTRRTFQTVARLCANEGKFEELWALKDLMRDLVKQGGLARPGSSIYVSLIRACGNAGRADLLLRCLAEMNLDQAPGKDWGTPALDEPTTLSAAVGALSKCDETVEADRLYADAIRRGVLPDPAEGRTWTTAASRAASTPTSTKTMAMEATTDRGRTERGGVSEQAAAAAGGDYDGKRCGGVERKDPGIDIGAGVATGDACGGGDDGGGDAALSGGASRDALLLWVDLRRAPVDVVPAAVRRVVQVLRAVGDGGDGLVVEWGGRRGKPGEEEEEEGGGGGVRGGREG